MICTGRILVADDEETFLNATADLLRQEGYECDCAADAASAMEKLRSNSYDLLISDIRMPGNLELEFIQAMPRLAESMPVILITGYPSAETAIPSISLPVVAYLVKPLDFDELLTHVRSAIEGHRSYQAVRRMTERLHDWQVDVTAALEAMKPRSPDGASVPLRAFVDLTLRNIVTSLADLKSAVEGVTGAPDRPDACHLLVCPRIEALLDGLRETIAALERTKDAFKSKELGQLRKKLEALAE